jgi:hypothetical protein
MSLRGRRGVLYGVLASAVVGAAVAVSALVASASPSGPSRSDALATCGFFKDNAAADAPGRVVATDTEGGSIAVVYVAGSRSEMCNYNGDALAGGAVSKAPHGSFLDVVLASDNRWQGIWTLVRTGPSVTSVRLATLVGDRRARPIGGGYWLAYAPAAFSQASVRTSWVSGVGNVEGFNQSGSLVSNEIVGICQPTPVTSMNSCPF